MTNIIEKTTSTKRVYDGRVINFRIDTVLLPNGKMSQREIIEHRGAVAIVPMIDRETVVLVRQYRAAAGGPLLEIPAGTRDPDEDITLCAHRELAEEINFSAKQMIKLFQSYVAPGYSTELIHTFVALGLEPAEGESDEDEFLEIIHVPLIEAIEKIKTGEIQDSKSIGGLLYVQSILSQLKFEE
jgi:ADP-ribose pyrophosphatase